MSLIGFAPTNHPQQLAARGSDDTVDERITPQRLFDALNAEHGFTLDAAANARNAKCPRFFDIATDGLSLSWAGDVVWCNPPYSNLPGWVAKAIREVRLGCPKVVMLLPANRTEQRWWQEHIEPFRDREGGGVKVRFLPGRVNFGTPGNPGGKYRTSSPFGLAVVTFIAPTVPGLAA
jgi:phage N-6-adenine-methyltransferase